jgi:hypothetical protein
MSMRLVVLVTCMWKMMNAYRIICGKPEERIPLRRPRRKFQDNIKMNLKRNNWEGVEHDRR